jgi:hypothetical protein
MGKHYIDPKSSEILSIIQVFPCTMQIALFWPKLLPALFLKKLWYPCPFEIMEETLKWQCISAPILRRGIEVSRCWGSPPLKPDFPKSYSFWHPARGWILWFSPTYPTSVRSTKEEVEHYVRDDSVLIRTHFRKRDSLSPGCWVINNLGILILIQTWES